MSNLHPNCCLKFDFQKVDQHAGGKWLIHDTKRSKDNQLQSLKLNWIATTCINTSTGLLWCEMLELLYSLEKLLIQGRCTWDYFH